MAKTAMNHKIDKNPPRPNTAPAGGNTAQGFFREFQIEFLIHEMKDPFAVIETGVRSLLEKKEKYGPLSERQERTLQRIWRSSRKAQSMLNDLLEIGRSQAGAFSCSRFQPGRSAYQALLDALETVSGSLVESLQTCADPHSAGEVLRRSGIQFEVEPAVDASRMCQDEVKFRQIVGNLIKNALHHRTREMVVRLSINADGLFTAAVGDDGPGIDPAHHQLIFQRYLRIDGPAASMRRGHGLGLAGALIAARSLGGDIQVKSQKGSGAVFTLTLPLNL